MSPVDFREVQRAFAAHLRDPATQPPPAGIEERRLAIYRDLFFNNVENFLTGFFPVLRSLYTHEAWLALARDFFAHHEARTPYFLEIATEFLAFLDNARGEHPDDPPYARELAHYEWLELALDIAEEELPTGGFDPQGDLLSGVPLLNPVAVVAPYHWPVHRIGPDHRPGEALAEPVFLLVYRDRADRVRFMEVNALTARLFTMLAGYPSLTGAAAAGQIASEIGHPDPAAVVAGAGETLALLRERDIVLGTRSPVP